MARGKSGDDQGRNGGDDKPSWREIDKARDKSRHGSREAPSGGRVGRARTSASKGYRQKLDRLFKEGTLGAAVAKLLDAEEGDAAIPIRAEESPANTTHAELLKIARKSEEHVARLNAVKRLVTEFELPGDFDVLGLALEHAEGRVRCASLERLEKLIAEGPPARKASLLQRLRMVEETSDDVEERKLVEKVRALLQ
ncbi:MAG: hypothetical protein HYY84_15765 [Deltaproteobacteria bacterium]|nr:hypothetical protein [Deltaproteobacteria bacterium]